MRTRPVCLPLVCVLACANAAAQRMSHEPDGKDVQSLATCGTDLSVGTAYRGVLHSSDNGTLWTAASTGLTDDSAQGGVAGGGAHDRLDFVVLGLGYSKDTFIPSVGGCEQIGVYFPEFFLPVTYLASDPYNGNKWNISWSALVPLGTAMTVSLVHYADAPGLRRFLIYAVLLPVIAANSQHHLVLFGPGGLVESTQYRFTAFVGCRTDCYSRDVSWVRWTPMAGLQQAFTLTGKNEEGATKWLALSGGIEAPIDIISGSPSRPSGWFIGLKYYSPF